MKAWVEQELRAAGAAPERVVVGGRVAFVLWDLAGLRTEGFQSLDGFFVLADGDPTDAIAAYAPGAAVVESGFVLLRGKRLALQRCPPGRLARTPVKTPEGRGNLGRRADWFRKRSG